MRVRRKPWASQYIQAHPEVVTDQPQMLKGSWHEKTGGAQLHVEVGTGKGRFVTEMAAKHPELHFVGVEQVESIIVTAVERVVEKELSNVTLIHGQVDELEEMFAPGEVDRLYMNFTDPWPKKRHEKRRLSYKDYLTKYDQVLKAAGEVHLKTDNQQYFEYSLGSFSENGWKLKNISLNLHESEWEADNIHTEYEEKFAANGWPIYRLEAYQYK
ncbi:tRNA (guanine-N(7)-)-methyltransferase [Salsuginibacillus halophilus]|uniref:tRNA (guanine-N(7)-)-methyltransferase n=1 Tax=Salsuginibacillus halophilus TaxID=517424 RepID=A0A2P8HE94_9BACI|nr:tRNA (guanosine(46)-N7)-methyltransferase TrmB [Salsuginibacillus halophilus]PSL44533.1 tRNA (guanine-N(7)-)-methyltransferase [Salsuginibacillus halophilus]